MVAGRDEIAGRSPQLEEFSLESVIRPSPSVTRIPSVVASSVACSIETEWVSSAVFALELPRRAAEVVLRPLPGLVTRLFSFSKADVRRPFSACPVARRHGSTPSVSVLALLPYVIDRCAGLFDAPGGPRSSSSSSGLCERIVASRAGYGLDERNRPRGC
jgi:hypothetical protein